MDGHMQGEFYIVYERPEDYCSIIRGLADIAGNPDYVPESIERSRHVNCVHVRFTNDCPALEDMLKNMGGVKQIERVPQAGIPEASTNPGKDN